jgi:hypothetical protein
MGHWTQDCEREGVAQKGFQEERNQYFSISLYRCFSRFGIVYRLARSLPDAAVIAAGTKLTAFQTTTNPLFRHHRNGRLVGEFHHSHAG